MSGSAASNLGYGNVVPFSNVNSNYVNVNNSHYPGGFGSNEIPGLPGLAGAKYNVDAAASRVPGICMSGGGKKLKRKIKNITKRYKMSKKSMRKKISSTKRKINKSLGMFSSKYMSGGKRKSRKMRKSIKGKKSRYQKGGYSQYQNNMPMTQTYSLGGNLSAANLALANPPPYKALSNDTSCVDNYNHYTNSGFPSRGN